MLTRVLISIYIIYNRIIIDEKIMAVRNHRPRAYQMLICLSDIIFKHHIDMTKRTQCYYTTFRFVIYA